SLTPEEAVSPAERLNFVERILRNETVSQGPCTMYAAGLAFAMLGLAAKILGDDARDGDLETVLRGLPHNVTTEMDLALWRLATGIRRDESATRIIRDTAPSELAAQFRRGTLPPVAQEGLVQFLALYGHRAVAEIDLGMPRWSDDPSHILG